MPDLVAACASGPRALWESLERGEPDDHDLLEYIPVGLSPFDEHHTDGPYEAVRRTLTMVPWNQRSFQLSVAQGVGAGILGV